MDILYYSNYCKHSQKVVQTLVKGNLAEKISFICIDKRTTNQQTNQTYIVLETGSKVSLPPNIHSVPSLLLVNKNYKVLMGDEIIQYYHKDIKAMNNEALRGNEEPMGFPLGMSSGGTNIVSEQFTMYDMSPDELSGKGIGGNRQMYNYVSASNEIQIIPTPPDTYRPDKLSNSVTIDTLQQQRMDEVAHMIPQKPFI
jgi:uncharacterized Fe-S cluster protein YjdI